MRSFKTNIDKSACFMADFFCQKIEKSIKFKKIKSQANFFENI